MCTSASISPTQMNMLNWVGAGDEINMFGVIILALTPPPPSVTASSMFQGDGMRGKVASTKSVSACVHCYMHR